MNNMFSKRLLRYNAKDWYWIVANERIFSSRADAYVQTDNVDLIAFINNSGFPTPIASETLLTQVLRSAGISSYLVIPEAVSMTAARKILLRNGITDTMVRNAITASNLTDQEKAEAAIDWEFSGEVHRVNPLVAVLGAALGLNDAGIDGLFVEASKL